MSISNLLSPNGYNLYCNSIQTPGDINEVVTKTVRVYSNTNVDIFNADILLKYVVRNGICTMWFPTTSTQTLTVNANYTFIYIAESAGGYVTIPCPDVSGEKLIFPITVVSQVTDITRTARMELDCNAGGTDTQGRLTITLIPSITTGGTTPNFTYAVNTGSNLFNTQCAINGFSISYPVEGAI